MTGATDMRLGAGRAVWLVARRELRSRLRSKAFIISTVLIVLVIVGYLALMNLISAGTGATVGFTGSTSAMAGPLKSAAKTVGQDVTTRKVDQSRGRDQVRDGTLDVLVTGSPTAMHLVVKKDLNSGLDKAFTVLAQQQVLNGRIAHLGGDPGQVNKAVAKAHVPVTALEHAGRYQLQRIVLGIVGVVLIYMSLIINGQAIAQGVIEEKSSRVVELLLATVRPWQLMAGKVLGLGLLGLLQMVIFAAIGAGLGVATGALDVPTSMLTSATIWTLVWFIIGFFMYSVLLAAAGALVSRQEDANSVVTPVLMLIMVPAIIGWSVLPSNPDSSLGHVLSMVPLFSPMLMPMRIALGVAPAWEIALSVVLSALLVCVLVALAGRVYRNAVLRVGARVKLTDALRAA